MWTMSNTIRLDPLHLSPPEKTDYNRCNRSIGGEGTALVALVKDDRGEQTLQ